MGQYTCGNHSSFKFRMLSRSFYLDSLAYFHFEISRRHLLHKSYPEILSCQYNSVSKVKIYTPLPYLYHSGTFKNFI